MQCWALLLNMGHMHDTFFAESILHRHFWKHWSKISPHFSRSWSRSLGKEILNDSDYRFHQLLSLLELEKLPKNSILYKPLAGLIGVYRQDNLPCMGIKTPSGSEYLRSAYKVVRNIAFLSLDSHYSRCPFGVTLPKLIAILPTFVRKILDNDELIKSQLGSLNRWMSNHYYCSSSSVVTMLDNRSVLSKNYARGLKKAISDKKKFLDLIANWKRETKAVQPAQDWHHVIRTEVTPTDDYNLARVMFPTYVRFPKTNPEYRLSVISVASNEYYLDVFARHTSEPYLVLWLIPQHRLLYILRSIRENANYQYLEADVDSGRFEARWGMVQKHCSTDLLAYINIIFKLLSKKNSTVQFQPDRSEGLGWLFCDGVYDAKRDLENYLKSYFESYASDVSLNSSTTRKIELTFTVDVVCNHLRRWETAMIYTGAIEVYDPKEGCPQTDIDGIAVLFRGDDVRLLLLQSKTSYKGAVTQAKKWFSKKIRPLLPALRGAGKYRVHSYKNGIAVSIDFKQPEQQI